MTYEPLAPRLMVSTPFYAVIRFRLRNGSVVVQRVHVVVDPVERILNLVQLFVYECVIFGVGSAKRSMSGTQPAPTHPKNRCEDNLINVFDEEERTGLKTRCTTCIGSLSNEY